MHSKDSDQTGRMPRLIWVFAGHTFTLLVLSCRGSHCSSNSNFCWCLNIFRTFKSVFRDLSVCLTTCLTSPLMFLTLTTTWRGSQICVIRKNSCQMKRTEMCLWGESFIVKIFSGSIAKPVFGDLPLGKTQTSLLSYRDWLESLNFGFSKYRYYTTKAANSKGADQTARKCRLICTFVVRIWHKQGFSWCGSSKWLSCVHKHCNIFRVGR